MESPASKFLSGHFPKVSSERPGARTHGPRRPGDQVTKHEEIKMFWAIGEDMNWFGKAFVCTIGLPFLVGFALAFRKSGS